MSLVPAISYAKSLNDKKGLTQRADTGIRYASLIGFPCAIGMSVLAKPILAFFYVDVLTPERLQTAAELLTVSALTVFLFTQVQATSSILQGLHQRYPWLHIIMEPGSAFAWQTGPLVSHVVDIVEDKGIRTAVLDVSFTCHMPDCLEMPYYPDVRGAQWVKEEPSTLHPSSSTLHQYRLGGNSCLSGDFMGAWQFDHELQVGEEVIFEDMIHYTTVKTCMFNGITHPSICMLHSDGILEILRQFGYEDYKNRMD